MRFTTTIELGGKTATGFEVPPDVVTALGKGNRPPVVVSLGGHTYRSTIARRGDRFLLPLSAENRAAAGVAAGDQVDVEVTLDTQPREVEVPADFSSALEAVPAARAHFEGLSYSNRLRLVLAIEGAKAAETRQRRIDKTVALLTEGRDR